MKRKKCIIMGAAGRDFHNFNVYFRGNKEYDVIAFTATQIPNIDGRKYPRELAGQLYPRGIPILPENDLYAIIRKHRIDDVYFAYSDISHEDLMHKASIVLAAGANFILLGTHSSTIKSTKPVISVCAVRTGAGKSQTSRKIVSILRKRGHRVVVVRHPMPYGDLRKQVCQRFATYEDLEKNKCTIEEREEYEPHLRNGAIVYAGVDYEKILRSAEKEADVILWDGGNNDFSFYRPDLHIVVTDPHRAGHEMRYHPGETNFRMAQVIIINKIDSAPPDGIKEILSNIKKYNPKAAIIKAKSDITVERPGIIRGKNVLVIEDGPTLTHGGMKFGAGFLAAKRYGAKKIVKPKPIGSIYEVYKKYPHLTNILPAMGYSTTQLKELEKTINKTHCDIVINGSPIDLDEILSINKPIVSVQYELHEIGSVTLEKVLKKAGF